MAVTLIILFVLATAVLAPLFGVDSRDGRDWQPRSLARGSRAAPSGHSGTLRV